MLYFPYIKQFKDLNYLTATKETLTLYCFFKQEPTEIVGKNQFADNCMRQVIKQKSNVLV